MRGIGRWIRCVSATIAGAIGMTSSGTGWAQCSPLPGPLITAAAAESAYVTRYNALVAGDPHLLRDDMAPGWRALLADVHRDRAVSIELIARIENRFAAALGQGDEIKEALSVARDALQIVEANGLAKAPLHAEVLSQLSLAEIDSGRVSDGIAHAQAAVAEARTAFGPRSWPTARAAIAMNSSYFAAGRYSEAEPFARSAKELAIACLPGNDPRIITRITSHAAVLGVLGRLDEALAGNEQAVSWAASHGQDHGYGMIRALNNLGWDLRNAGRYREAEGVLRNAVDLAARYHAENWQLRAEVLGKFADVLQLEGKGQEAETLLLEASEFDRKVANVSNPLIGSGEIRRAASAAEARGDLPLALARREQAVALIASHAPPTHPELARARIEYATTLSLAGLTGKARALADPAIATLRSGMLAGNFQRMGAEIAYAQIVGSTGDTATAYQVAAPVVQNMETTMMDAAASRRDLVRFAPSFSTGFATATKLALVLHHDDGAFHDLQLANFSDLAIVDADIAARAATDSPVARGLMERLRRQVLARQQLDRDRIRAVSNEGDGNLATLNAAIQTADADIGKSTSELDRLYPAYRQLGRPTPVSLAAFRARLGAHDILIAPLSLAGETLTVVVTRDGLSWTSAPVGRARLNALVGRVRASISAARSGGQTPFDVEAARQLYEASMPPALAPVMRNHRHILYYASGALAKVPPALLIELPLRRGRVPAWLIRSHSISVLPTLDARRPVDAYGRDFLGVGAPLLTGSPTRAPERGAAVDLGEFGVTAAKLPELPRAAQELRSMAASFPEGDRHLMLGKNATERALKTMPLGQVGIMAFATHGLMRDALPGLIEPALVLTPPETPDAIDDGLLAASEVANLHLHAQWVILSACDTAGGSDPDDASYNGLARAFIEAGAQALLVSHWAVRDDAAERLTVATLRATRRGIDRATALQHATIALMQDPSVPGSSNPAVWAPFVLVE